MELSATIRCNFKEHNTIKKKFKSVWQFYCAVDSFIQNVKKRIMVHIEDENNYYQSYEIA